MIVRGFRDDYCFLSNFYQAPITYQGLTYLNNEAAFQAQKCLARASEFCNLDAKSAKALGKKVILRNDWEAVKDHIMYAICYAKFTQNDTLKLKLIELSNDVLLEENNWGDMYWGTVHGKGQNKLGGILMHISEELTSFKVIIAGGRDFNDYTLLKHKCDKILGNIDKPIIIVSGGAKGADKLGERYAKERNYNIKQFIPDWSNLGKKAGILRNKEMSEYGDALIAFWDNASRGTANMIETAQKKGMPVRIIKYEES